MCRQNKDKKATSELLDYAPYDRMRVGETFEIRALDGLTHRPRNFRVQVIHINEMRVPLFLFFGDDFHFVATDTQQPFTLKQGSIAMATDLELVRIESDSVQLLAAEGITKGSGLPFRNLDAKKDRFISLNVTSIRKRSPAKDWRPPQALIRRYLSKLARRRKIEEARKTAHAKAFEAGGPYKIWTLHSVYYLGRVEGDGYRALRKAGTDWVRRVKVRHIRLDERLTAELKQPDPDRRLGMSISTVVRYARINEFPGETQLNVASAVNC